ncbi:DegV family protein [Alicyclobacillus sp.]|uniref:DegV family protein n=1 Tax=Alicyclobacillus sp. TaxID=61169 RepID=UPI0025BDA119|nr:DegV family protein [Alicyclobacillus sp.]MCL6517452.1 DegV family protein [Alicyclobacillus sp.]
MERIAFVTDSTAYLTKEQQDEHRITVVPLSVIFEDGAYREGVDITAEEFYQKLAEAKSLPSTSQPPVGEFKEVFERLLTDYDTILCYLLSSKLSGTCRAAETASRMVEGDVRVVDSEYASYGIAGPLLDGVRMAEAGRSADEIVAYWERIRAEVKSLFIIDTLEYLHRGGRIGGAAAVFGALLQIKPILTVIDGKLELFDKVRTHRRAMERMLAEFDAAASTGRRLRVGVVHSRRPEDAEALRAQLVDKYPNVEAEVSELGPVIGTHTGPGVLAILYYPALEL